MVEVLNRISEESQQMRVALAKERKQSQKAQKGLLNQVANLSAGMKVLQKKILLPEGTTKQTHNTAKHTIVTKLRDQLGEKQTTKTTDQKNSNMKVNFQPSTSASRKKKSKQA